MSIRLGDSIIARANMDFSDVVTLLTETNDLVNDIIENDDTNTAVITDSMSENKDAISASIDAAKNNIVTAIRAIDGVDLTTTNYLLQTTITLLDGIESSFGHTENFDLTTTNNLIQICINQLSRISNTLANINSNEYQTKVLEYLESIDSKL